MQKLLSVSLITLVLVFGSAVSSYAQANNPNPTEKLTQRPQRPKLNLTSAQKEQMRALRDKTRQQIQAVLTPQQFSQLEASKQSRQSRREVMLSLNLTESQKQQMRAIREESKKQRMTILTPEQRTQLEQMRRDRPKNPRLNPQ